MPRPSSSDLQSLSRSPLFRGVAPAVVASFAQRGTAREFPAGTELWREGDASDGMAYVLLSGDATVSMDGKPFADLGPGDILGEYALVSEGPRSATVRTKSATRCVAFDRSAVADLLAQDGSPLGELVIRRVKENSSANRGAFRGELYVEDEG